MLRTTLSDPSSLCNVLKTIKVTNVTLSPLKFSSFLIKEITVTLSHHGIKFTSQIAKSFQVNAFFCSENFTTYEFQGETVTFDLSISSLIVIFILILNNFIGKHEYMLQFEKQHFKLRYNSILSGYWSPLNY